ncbi:MAG: hypothetical protein ACQES1_04985 [Bacteroidota bacterium]
MTRINKHNYEAYLLDFMEGNLSAEDAKALEAFLNDNPQLNADIFDPGDLKIKPDTSISFDKKTALKRDEEMPEFSKREKLLIGLAEDDLNEDEKQEAQDLLSSDAEAFNDFELYRKLKFKAGSNISYPDKEGLKKRTPVVSIRQVQYISIAAVLAGLLAFGLLKLNLPDTGVSVNSQHVAQNIDKHIVFDAEKTSGIETDLSDLSMNKLDKETQVAYNHLPVANRQIRQTEQSEAEKFVAEPMPRLSAGKIQTGGNDRSTLMAMTEREIPAFRSALPVDDITYVSNNSDKNRGINLPNRSQIQNNLDKFKPIEQLREAKNELMAGNVRSLFD